MAKNATAEVFRLGSFQPVQLPKESMVQGAEVDIRREGYEIVLREKPAGMELVLDLIAQFPADIFRGKRQDPKPQRRKGL